MTSSDHNQTSHSVIAVDLLFTLGTLFGLKYLLLQFEVLWTFAGPISLLAALAMATWRLKRNNQTWQSLGFVHSTSHIKLVFWTLGALVITIVAGSLAGAFAGGLLPSAGVSEQANSFMQNRFSNVPGNLPHYLYWLMIGWVIGGFTEELLFRGFLLTHFEKLFSKLPFPIIFAVVIQALIFGQQHMYYQGAIGLVETGMVAVVSGAIYVLSKRRLWPLIISHGLANTLGMTMIFLGPVAGN